jgi:hypothetical protein
MVYIMHIVDAINYNLAGFKFGVPTPEDDTVIPKYVSGERPFFDVCL